LDIGRFFSYIAQGTAYTLGVTLVALPSGLILGLLFAFLAVYAGKLANRFFSIYSTIMRGIPPIVLLFILTS